MEKLLWGPPAGPRRGPRPAFTLDDIARAGIAIADSDGLAAVTMQRVADQLGVTKMALYRYVPGKAELVALMLDIGIGGPPARDGDDWRTALDAWSHALFAALAAHPWALEAAVGARVIGPNELGWMEAAVAALGGTGLRGAEMLDVAATLAGHVRSLAQQTAGMPADAEGALEEGIAALVAGREDRFPALSAAVSAARAGGQQNQALDFGLARILDGVATLIAERAADATSTHPVP
ncbi:TetR family transcriptional regulator [Asanoa ishikariensis]|uniref:Transcriptional regulator, TetR family n=1 Tax=Asanoa ishikariensis TaxID=137265 RepID=A0A1H3MXH0_9ACTN|nr:TetR/AcrR family transcriptional regulator [Asanoa ishikariensis]GIF68981.1 TetR family transcriptional regulator [Asanoa ishikariensis]SDY81397.1 transcriptional regulator, TetR family [Asanoa ishikariensis]